jgi:uncharacterized protein (TIGR04255 family)
MEEREVYSNAPVVLVALEVRHPTAGSLSSAQRAAIKSMLGKRTPIMRSGRLQEVTATVGAVSDLRVEEFPRYFSRDSTSAVSIRSEAVVVETTRYVRWERLLGLVIDALQARQKIGDVDGVERVGLRLVNEIRVPVETGHDWAPWVDGTLLGPAALGPGLGLVPQQWQGVSAFTPGPERSLVVRYGPREGYAVDPADDLKRTTPFPGPFFLMDIDSFWTPSEGVPEFDVEALLGICDELHAPVRTLFERLITERLREEVLRNGR